MQVLESFLDCGSLESHVLGKARSLHPSHACAEAAQRRFEARAEVEAGLALWSLRDSSSKHHHNFCTQASNRA